MVQGAVENQRKGRMTARELAGVAGVSVSTFSNVLNGRVARYSPETVKRIHKVVGEYHYVPNQLVRSLQSRRTGVLGVRLGNNFRLIKRPYSVFALGAIVEVVRELGYELFLDVTAEDPRTETFLDGRTDGVIISGLTAQTVWEDLGKMGFPCVVMNYHLPCKGFGAVCGKNQDGMIKAVKHLFSLGHRRIGYHVSEPEVSLVARERFKGFQRAMNGLNCPIVPEYVFEGTFDMEQGTLAARHWLSLKDRRPTAVICDHYEAAMDAMACFQKAGLVVPRDISILGVDDLEEVHPTYPPLTVITPPLKQMIQDAVRFVVAMIEGTSPDQCRRFYPMELVIKGSTGPEGIGR